MAGTDINQVCISGRLTADIDVKELQGGTLVGNFTIATNRMVKNNWGEVTQKTAFLDCALYGKIVGSLRQYLSKGKEVLICGRVEQDRWEKEGQKFSRVRIYVEHLKLLGRVSNTGASAVQTQVSAQQPSTDYRSYDDGIAEDGFPEEIPF